MWAVGLRWLSGGEERWFAQIVKVKSRRVGCEEESLWGEGAEERRVVLLAVLEWDLDLGGDDSSCGVECLDEGVGSGRVKSCKEAMSAKRLYHLGAVCVL